MAKEKLSQYETEELQSILWWLSSVQKDEMLELLKKDKKERRFKEKQLKKSWELPKEDISVHKEEIAKYLSKLVNVEPDVEFMWHKWKKITIELPVVGEFKWYKTTFFSWDYYLFWERYKKEIKPNKELVEKMYRWTDICNFLEQLKKCIKELHKYIYKTEVNIDEKIYYLNDLICDNKKESEQLPITDISYFLESLGLSWTFYLNNEEHLLSWWTMQRVWRPYWGLELDRENHWAALLLKC